MKPRAELLTFVMDRISNDREQVLRAMRWYSVLNPLFDQAEHGKPGLQPIDALSLDDFSDALAVFLGSASRGLIIQFVSAGRGDYVPRDVRAYREFLAPVVVRQIGQAQLALSESTVLAFKEVYWNTIGLRLFAFLANRYHQAFMNADQRIVAVAAEGYTALPFAYLLHVMAGNEERVREMAPLLRQLSQAVPIGQLKDDGLAWIALCG